MVWHILYACLSDLEAACSDENDDERFFCNNIPAVPGFVHFGAQFFAVCAKVRGRLHAFSHSPPPPARVAAPFAPLIRGSVPTHHQESPPLSPSQPD